MLSAGGALLLGPVLTGQARADAKPERQQADDHKTGAAATHGADSAPARQAGRPENIETAQRARQYFSKGMQLFRKHAYRESIQQFTLAARLVPSADLWYNIARAYQELSEYALAIEYYERYLRDRVDPPDRAKVETHIANLRERLEAERAQQLRRPTKGVLRLRINLPRARVQVGQERIENAPQLVTLELPPGRYPLQVKRPGHLPYRAQVRVRVGLTTAAYADLQPQTEYLSRRKPPRWTWVVGSLAAGALIASGAMGIKAATMDDEAGEDRWARRSDALLGVGLALGVATAITYFLERKSVSTERSTARSARGGGYKASGWLRRD
ncbi:MAG: PEGA domain-containing protein [Polyangiales bacterium]